MLELLHIENIAVIESADISFRPGFNALTGETGAGKSIVIDAMSAVLGGRASRELIRTGADKAFVSAVFSQVPPTLPGLADNGVTPDEDGNLLLQREIGGDGKNVCRANGRPLTVTQLRQIGGELLNIHGQHDGQQLLDEEQHGAYLDRFGRMEAPLAAYRSAYDAMAAIRDQIRSLQMNEAEKARRMDSLRFQIDELERAELVPGEEEELNARRELLRNGEKYIAALSGADYCLSGDDNGAGAVSAIREAEEALRGIRTLSDELGELYKRLESIRCEVYDLAETIRDKRAEFAFSPAELDAAEARTDQLYRLKKKYGATVEDMIAYLAVLNNPEDDLRLTRIINNPPRGIGATTLDKVGALAESQGASLYEIIRNADLFPELKASSAKLLKFADLIDGLRRAGTELALPEFYDAVCDQTGYVKALEEKNDMESRGRIENVQELKSNILGFLEQQPEDATLSGFLNEIALYTDLDSVEASDDCVTMMTIHSAKGLEFPVVYVVGMEEGIFPGASAQYDQEELEEERRLCYVAMTRAKEKLTLTNCRQRMLYGRTSANRASRFLEEIPEENMRWESKPEPKFGTYDEDGFGGSRWGDDFGGGSFGGSSYSGSSGRSGGYVSGGVHTYKSTKPAAQTLRTSSRGSTPAAPSVGLIQLSQGDQVEHTAFGKGTVVSVKPMGGDALAEVAFEGGTKKLMLKAAGKHLKKL